MLMSTTIVTGIQAQYQCAKLSQQQTGMILQDRSESVSCISWFHYHNCSDSGPVQVCYNCLATNWSWSRRLQSPMSGPNFLGAGTVSQPRYFFLKWHLWVWTDMDIRSRILRWQMRCYISTSGPLDRNLLLEIDWIHADIEDQNQTWELTDCWYAAFKSKFSVFYYF